MSVDQYKAKRHSILESLKSDLSRGFLDKEVTVRGYKFKIHTLNEDEESWADAYVRVSTPLTMLNSRKAPRLAASIKAVNDIPVDQLFIYPDTMTDEQRKNLNDNPIQRRYWCREQMMLFLAEDAIRPFIDELYGEYSKLEEERDKAIAELPKN